MAQQTKRRKGETPAEYHRRKNKGEDIEAAGDSKINKGLASLASKAKPSSESQAEGVEKAKPKPSPTPDNDDKDKDDPAPTPTPTPTPKPAKPKRSDFPDGLPGQAAYGRALTEWRRNNSN